MAYVKPWHVMTGPEAASELKRLCGSAYEVNSDRIAAALQDCSMFEGIRVTVPAAGGYDRAQRNLPGSGIPHIRRKAHSTVMGTHALMFCNDNPIPMFTVNGGDWEEHTQATLLNQAVQEEYKTEQGQGRFNSAHDMWRKGGLTGLASTGGFMIFTWPGFEQAELELDDTLGVILDSAGPNSPTLGLARTGYYDPDWLIAYQEAFTDKPLTAEQIYENVIEVTDIEWVKGTKGLQQKNYRRQVVAVRQGWRNKIGKTDGRMMAVLDRGQVLWDKPYTRRELAPAWWQLEPELFGDWSPSLTSLVYHLCARINEMTWDTDQTQRNTAQRIMFATKEQIDDFGQVKGIQFVPVANKATDPRLVASDMFNKDALLLIDRYEAWSDQDGMTERNHSTGGSGQMANSGKQEHMRASYWTELHASASRRAVDCIAIQQGRRFVWAFQDMVTAGVELTRYWGPEGSNREEITVNDLNLDESRFSKSISAISEEANSPQAKLDEAKEWLEIGKLDSTGYVALRQHLDTTAETEDTIQERKWVDDQIRKWTLAPRERLLEPDFYQSPRRWLDPEWTAKRVQSALMKAESQGMAKTEPERLEFFELFLDELAYFMEQDQAQAATQIKAEAPLASLFPALGGGAPGVATSGNPIQQQPAGGLPAASSPGSPGQLPGNLPSGPQG